ncbi:MAG: serine/threonine-protein kinase [Pseudomonadota bacterium]
MSGRLGNLELERQAIELLEEALEQPKHAQRTHIEHAVQYNEAVRERAQALLKHSQTDQNSFRTGQASQELAEDETPLPGIVGAYRILRLLGRGGMGNVYLAERASDDFDHIAAIKVIKHGLLSDETKERFRRERQLLAGLNHPNIAQLFDGGELDDGSPYIIMEYIDGQPLSVWLQEMKPLQDKGLEVFQQICDAVSFAHQNLVIHRDLTPANVLIAPEGLAKLIDFGIARSEEEADTAVSSTTGYTPDFAAPERQAGEAANVLSDVYSLGKLLALILKGTKDRELKAIIDKACAQEPNERYPSVTALSQDIEAYRSAFPISIFKGAPLYSLRKFAIRQKALVGTAAAFVLVLVIGLVAISSAYHSAQLARSEAEEAFAETRQIASTMMFEVYDEVQKVPGGTNAQVLLARTSQRYLDELSSRPGLARDVRLDAGLGYLRLARVVGSTRGNTLGDLASGSQMYDRAQTILAQVYAEAPDDPLARIAYGRALVTVAGETLFTDADIEVAKGAATEAQDILVGLSATDMSVEAAVAIGQSYYFLSEAAAWDGDYKAAIAHCDEGVSRIDEKAEPFAGDLAVRRIRATLLSAKSGHMIGDGQFDAGISVMQETIDMRTKLVEASGEAPADMRTLTISHYMLAQAYLQQDQSQNAAPHAMSAFELSSAAMKADLDDTGPKELFAATAIQAARISAVNGKNNSASGLLDEAISVSKALRDRNADMVAGPLNYAVRLYEASEVYAMIGAEAKVCDVGGEAADILRALAASDRLPQANREGTLIPLNRLIEGC